MRALMCSLAAFAAFTCSSSCAETQVTRYATVGEARADQLFERGWLPDVLPETAGPVTEVHDIDTNARCALAHLAPGDFDDVVAALVREGFQRHEGTVPSRPLSACPFGDDDLRNARTIFRRRSPIGGQEFAAVDKQGKMIFMSGE